MKNILLPVDFPSNGYNAYRYATEIGKNANAKVIIMPTIENPAPDAEVPLITVPMDNVAADKLNKYKKEIKNHSKKLNVEILLQQGISPMRINEVALDKKADLIVIDTAYNTAVERITPGTNGFSLMRKSPCMVLSVPKKAKYNGLKKIVYTTDFSGDNLKHADELISFAKIFNSEILFLNINTGLLADHEDDLEGTAKKIKEQINYKNISGYMCNDVNVAAGINHFLNHHKADCLAIYVHHRSAFKNLFKPDILENLSVHSSIPLLIIHENDNPV